MLAKSWDRADNPAGWFMSEKFDGVRALWTGTDFYTRNGNRIHAPASLTGHMPPIALDGELWMGRGRFQQTAGVVRSKNEPAAWDQVRFVAFDAPHVAGTFETRQLAMVGIANDRVQVAEQHLCDGRDHLSTYMASITDGFGEGVMLRAARSAYENRRSPSLRKLKYTGDIDAVVIGHEAGKGRLEGVVGALLIFANGTTCRVGAGLSDDAREEPPAIGATVAVAHSGFTDRGALREPRFLGERADNLISHEAVQQLLKSIAGRPSSLMEA